MEQMEKIFGNYAYKKYSDSQGTVRYIACRQGNNKWHYQQYFDNEIDAERYCKKQQKRFEVSYDM